MRKTFLALSILALALVGALLVGVSLGVAQTGSPVANQRPTPTPDVLVPPPTSPSPASPDIPPLPDLVVESIEVEPSSPLIGQEVIINVTIKNQGVSDVPVYPDPQNFWSDLYIDPAIVPIQLGQDGQWSWGCQARWVPVGGSYTLITTTNIFTDVKTYSLYAQVDTDGHVPESNENNNVFGPVQIRVRAPNRIVQQSHEDFQMGWASGLDISHPQGVMRRGIFEEPYTEPEVYWPDVMVNDITGTMEGGELLPTTVNQVKPALTSNGNGVLYAAWEDGRNGGVFNRDIYFSRSIDGGTTWGSDVRINDDPIDSTRNQGNPDLQYDESRGRLYAVWQDARNGNYDIYFAYSTDGGNTWSANQRLNDDAGTAHQMEPSIIVGPSIDDLLPDRVYVVWQDQRNGNDDVYLVRSNNGGLTWSPNYFVTDDPEVMLQDQVAPSVGVDGRGKVFVCWEDWRDPLHPEIFVAQSEDEGQSFGIDVPVSIPESTSYRLEPSMAVSTTTEIREEWDPVQQITIYIPFDVTAIHVAWREIEGDNSDVYWAYATHNYEEPKPCPYPYRFCFEPPEQVNGFVIDSDYALPSGPVPVWPIEPSWQGEVSLARAFANDWTYCHATSPFTYSKGVFLVWSDAQSYDDWRYELHVRRAASPAQDPETYELCEDQSTGMLNDNPKLYAYRDGLDELGRPNYEIFKPAATRQSNPYVHAEEPPSANFFPQLYVVWDDDRWDKPLEPGTVRNRDIFFARHGSLSEAIYISPVFDALLSDAQWYVLSWWGATEQLGDLLFQTRFGVAGASYFPPKEDVAEDGWTRWTGNPSSTYLGCTAGEGCYYDAPGRHIVRPDGTDWIHDPDHAGQYRYIQYKVIIRGSSRLTALSQVSIFYKGGGLIYLPIVRNDD